MTAVTDYLRAVRETAREQATEHSYRPHLKALLEALRPGAVATNEPKHRRDCGAPDMSVADGSGPGAVTIGYVECKDIDTHLDEVERSEQLTRIVRSISASPTTPGRLVASCACPDATSCSTCSQALMSALSQRGRRETPGPYWQ